MLPINYVYLHRDPRNEEVRYVGAGSKGRAWACGWSSKGGPRRGNRTRDHQNWLNSLFNLGYTMGNIVEVVAQGLSKTDAHSLETDFIREQDFDLLFNIQIGLVLLLINEDDLQLAQKLRVEGVSYAKIGAILGVSSMTVYRALNGQTKGYKTNEFA